MATEYKITVERIETDVPFTDKTWEVVSDTTTNTGQDAKRDRKYDYVETERLKDVTTKIFEQKVDKLELAELVLVINKKEQ